MAPVACADGRVDLLETTELLHRHLDAALCEEVFASVREKERRRRARRSLTQVLEEGRRGGDGLVPPLRATLEAFFQRCKGLPSFFFGELYRRFGARLLPEALASYASSLAELRERFREIWAIDGSKLDAVAHRLRILRK